MKWGPKPRTNVIEFLPVILYLSWANFKAMPLFMDFHQGLSVTIEGVKNAYIAYERVQDKYGEKYHQFWMNEKANTGLRFIHSQYLPHEPEYQTDRLCSLKEMLNIKPGNNFI